MTEQTPKSEEQRGKRKTARYTEIVLTATMIAALFEVPNAFEIFEIVLIPGLTYCAALRGLDGMFAARHS